MKNRKFLIIIFVVFITIFSIAIFRKPLNNINESDDYILADSIEPKLIESYYDTNHYIVADYVVSPSSGDMTSTIINALNKCKDHGGTVWLERGIYNVSSPITIPSGCTLMGDWQDPDNYQGTLDYGTKIVVDVKNFKSDTNNYESTGLFKLQTSSGVEGLTIYYKNQKINSPTPMPWTFNYNSDMLKTIKNVTLINSYMAIGRNLTEKSAHEMLMIENVKGTVLKTGVTIHNSSDVGTITGLTFSPKYLAKANLKAFNDNSSNNSESAIASAIKANGGIGLIITDAEQSQFVNITLSGFKYGIYIPDASIIQTRYMGSGDFYNLNISNCDTGIMVESGVYNGKTLVDFRWGYLISNSVIEGSNYAIYTKSVAVGGKRGSIKLNDVSIKGKVSGDGPVYYNSSSNNYTQVAKNTDLTGKVNNTNKFSNLNLYRKLKNDGNKFTSIASGSSVDTINKALSTISSNGGGVVYLKPGSYQIDKTINIPTNVELRGSSSTSNRKFNVGTTLNVIGNVTAIKVNGNNSGISGINIIYEKNVNLLSKGPTYNNYPYSIVIENANNAYVKNVSIAAASHGIYVNRCNNFSLENIVTGVLDSGIRVDNSSNGLIMNTLQNGTIICRNKLYAIDEGTANFNYIMNPNTKKKLLYIYLNGSNNIELQNTFTFGSYVFLTAINSKFYSVNSGYDGTVGIFYDEKNSDFVLVNGLKMNGQTIRKNGGSPGIYNVATHNAITERDTLNTIYKVSKMYNTANIKLSSSSLTLNKIADTKVNYRYDGDGVLSCNSSSEQLVKCSIDSVNKALVIKPVAKTNSPVTITISSTRGKYYNSTKSSLSVSVNTGSNSNGDIDGNGKVNTTDYLLIRKHLLGKSKLSGTKLTKADVNGDSKVTIKDYLAIRKLILGGSSKTCPQYYSLSNGSCYDNTAPVINSWENTTLSNTTINRSSATTTICNLGSDKGDGLKTIEYYTDCSSPKTATISNNCATITISACKNSNLYYQIKDNYNYSNLNTVSDIGKYLIYAQVYNRILYLNTPAANNSNNLGYWVKKSSSIDTNISSIGDTVIKERTSDSNTTFIKYLYRAIHGREAETDGLNYWVNALNKGTSRKDAINNFVKSSEAKNIYTAWGYN